jgi:hypothetical protein
MTTTPFNPTLAEQASYRTLSTFAASLPLALNTYRQCYNSIFNVTLQINGAGQPAAGKVAPSDVVAALGVNAGPILSSLSLLYTFLQSINIAGLDAADVVPAYTINQDGTATFN